MASRREQAGLPTYPELRRVTLRSMRAIPLPATNDEINEAVADALGLSDVQRTVMHVNGRQTELAYRVAWARSFLKAVGAADSAGRASWMLTSDGRSMSSETIEERYSAYQVELRKNQEPKAPTLDDEDDLTPELDWKARLLDRLSELSPAGFEQLAGRLLVAAGFHDVKVLGRSGDAGVDCVGMYRLSLVSFPTYVQCKRYQSAVSAGTVRDFRGAMIGRGDRGLIITTGVFTRGAKVEATRDGAPPIELLDGEALCDLLKDYRMGVDVQERRVEDISLDQTYFDRFEGG